MSLTNQELVQELKKRIKSQQITLAIHSDYSVKECAWSNRRDQVFLKTADYSLNLTELFEQIENSKTKHCNCSQCHGKDFFTFLFKNLKFH